MLATEKQVAFLVKLANERELGLTGEEMETRVMERAIDRKEASVWISAALEKPKKAEPAKETAAPGYYVHDDEFLVVVSNRAKTKTYAKRLIFVEASNGAQRPSWEYAPGRTFMVSGMEPMTVEQAAAFGHLHGYCLVCCKPLTDPKSVQAGLGPVCIKRFTN